MKVLFISNDPSLFEEKSAARARMRTYATAIGELHIISRATVAQDTQEDGLYLHALCPLPTWFGRVLFLRTLVTCARKIINKYDIEVVSAQDPFEHGTVALRAVRNTSAKLHIQVHTDFLSPYFAKESHKNRLRVRIADSVLPKANGIRVVSERIKKSLMERYGKRIQEPVIIPLVPEIVPIDSPSTPLDNLPFTYTLMSVGRLEKEKRFGDAIRVVSSLVRERYPVGLILIGSGRELKFLKGLAKEQGVEKNIIFLGAQSEVMDLLPTAQTFLQTSAYEGYGRTYLEAAVAGVPIVTTDAGVVGEIFVHDDSALVCPVGDVKCLTLQVSRLIEDSALRHTLSERACEVALEHLRVSGNLPARIAADFETLKKDSGEDSPK